MIVGRTPPPLPAPPPLPPVKREGKKGKGKKNVAFGYSQPVWYVSVVGEWIELGFSGAISRYLLVAMSPRRRENCVQQHARYGMVCCGVREVGTQPRH